MSNFHHFMENLALFLSHCFTSAISVKAHLGMEFYL